MKSSETYRRYARDIDAFADALYRLLQVMEPHTHGLLYDSPRSWTPREGQEAEAARLRAEVDRLTGRAAYAFQAAGSVIHWSPRGVPAWQTMPLNPAASWPTILDSDPNFDVDGIFTCARQAIPLLEMKAEEAEERERQKVRRALRAIGRLTGSGLRPLARWTVRIGEAAIVAAVGTAVTLWLA